MNRMKWSGGGGFAGRFFAVGFALMFALTFHFWWVEKAPPALPAVLGGAGLAALLSGSGVVVDREKKRLIHWRGFRIPFLFGVPLWWKRRNLAGYSQVVLRREYRRSGKNGYWTYSLFLQGEYADLVWDVDPYRKAREDGERLAQFLGFALRDEGDGGPPAVREAGTLDQPLLERLRGAALPAVARPAEAKLTLRQEGARLIFEAPKDLKGAIAAVRTRLAVMGAIAATLLFELSLEARPPGWLLGIVFGIIGVLGAMGGFSIHAATRRVRLTASPEGLRLDRTSLFVSIRAEIPAGELEELDVAPSRLDRGGGRVLGGRSDRRVIEFGHGLTEAELEWVRSEALAAMRG